MSKSFISGKNKLTNLQLEFLKSLKYMVNEQQMSDIKSLIRYYFAQQLDSAIEKQEKDRGYTADIYQKWLEDSTK